MKWTLVKKYSVSWWAMSALLLFTCITVTINAIVNDNHQSTYYQQWCSDNAKKIGYCKYLDDTGCNKYFPSSYNRDFMWLSIWISTLCRYYTHKLIDWTVPIDMILLISMDIIQRHHLIKLLSMKQWLNLW